MCVSKRQDIKIIAGTGSFDTVHAVHMCRTAQSMGADGLLMVTPYYNKTTARLIKHYLHMNRVDIPNIRNVPSRTGLAATAETMRAQNIL